MAETDRSSTQARRPRRPPAWGQPSVTPPCHWRHCHGEVALGQAFEMKETQPRPQLVHPVLGRPDRKPGTLAEQEASDIGSAQDLALGVAAPSQYAALVRRVDHQEDQTGALASVKADIRDWIEHRKGNHCPSCGSSPPTRSSTPWLATARKAPARQHPTLRGLYD